ncbi:MAG: NUDIX domain-containing protein [Anaerolineales bacterium]|nr:NUDIX domain-containing protein [Anaerolineales bacterium]
MTTFSTPEMPELLRRQLSNRRSSIRTEWDAKPAAVLLPLYWEQEEWHLLFTRRTEKVESHRGQVSFPGGVIDSSDQDACQTALREAEEEIGIRKDDVNILGKLDPLLTVTQFIISPVVGTIPWPYHLQINTQEVATAFGVPLAWLADEDNLEIQTRELPIQGGSVPIYYFKPYRGEVIWGATARITLNFLDLLQTLSK